MNENKNNMTGLINMAVSALPMVINTVTSAIKDKKAKKESATEFLENDDNLKKGVSISSKRLMTVVGAPSLVMYGIKLMETQPKYGLLVMGLGVVYGLGMAYVTHISEKADKPTL